MSRISAEVNGVQSTTSSTQYMQVSFLDCIISTITPVTPLLKYSYTLDNTERSFPVTQFIQEPNCGDPILDI